MDPRWHIRETTENKHPRTIGDWTRQSGFQNEGDNEITGFHVSDGDPKVNGILGAKSPHPFKEGWRVFFTNQHGDDITDEIVPDPSSHAGD